MHFSVSRFVCFRFTGGSLRAWWNVIVRRPKKLFEGGGKHQLHTQTHTKVQLAEYIQTREKPYWEESFSSLFSEGHHQDLSSACREREREREAYISSANEIESEGSRIPVTAADYNGGRERRNKRQRRQMSALSLNNFYYIFFFYQYLCIGIKSSFVLQRRLRPASFAYHQVLGRMIGRRA